MNTVSFLVIPVRKKMKYQMSGGAICLKDYAKKFDTDSYLVIL